jgi:hypothetical protein
VGDAIAHRLMAAGNHAKVYNRTRSRAEALKTAGAVIADSPADASSGLAVIPLLADAHGGLKTFGANRMSYEHDYRRDFATVSCNASRFWAMLSRGAGVWTAQRRAVGQIIRRRRRRSKTDLAVSTHFHVGSRLTSLAAL